MSVSDQFTPSQRRAVEHREGPLLVLAGPGSGKTRVVTHRIAAMTTDGIDPGSILAITFTNKAAGEMVDRVAALIPGTRVWISTFHRFCSRLLRSRAEAVGLQSNFSILDSADQKQLVRQILHDLNIDSVHFPPRRISSRISKAKNEMNSAGEVARRFSDSVGNHLEAVVARVYPEYQKRLLQSNSVDFDDLLLHVVALLGDNPELRAQLGDRYRYVMVDEYQDTNRAQYRIVSALAERHHNLCVTGDPDQSIYGWRGAKIDNILRFEADFPNATVVRLEQNFRSTGRILKAAGQLIANNIRRKAKSLVTDNADGEPVQLLQFHNGVHEAHSLAAAIRDSVECRKWNWSDFAIFYRVNALSREIERALVQHRVPYRVAAGVAFFERAEIKDVLAYLRLINNPSDETAFRRIVNTPRRGIGKTTVGRLAVWAAEQHISLLEAAARSEENPAFSKRPVKLLAGFAELISELSLERTDTVKELIAIVLERTGYGDDLAGSESEQDQQRQANVDELLSAAEQHDLTFGEDATLETFLETACLVNETDNIDESANCVTLMTLHAAKGLEFPVVYIVAVEQSLIPHERSLRFDDDREIEEERRLLFVGMTRAKRQLFLTETYERTFRGRRLSTIRSEFLREIVVDERDETANTTADMWISKGDESDRDSDTIGVPLLPPPPTPSGNLDIASGGNSATLPLLMSGTDLLNASRGEAVSETPGPLPEPLLPPLRKTLRKLNVLGGGSSAALPRFAVGAAVRHPQRGVGIIVEVGGFSKRRTVTVAFDDDERTVTYVIDQCPLQPVGLGTA